MVKDNTLKVQNVQRMIEKMVVLGNAKISPKFSVEHRALCHFMASESAPASIKTLLEKVKKCEKLLEMIAKSRRRLFSKAQDHTKPMRLLRQLMSPEDVDSLVESDVSEHFDRVYDATQQLKFAMQSDAHYEQSRAMIEQMANEIVEQAQITLCTVDTCPTEESVVDYLMVDDAHLMHEQAVPTLLAVKPQRLVMCGAFKHGLLGRLANFCQMKLGVQYCLHGQAHRLFEAQFGKAGREMAQSQ